MLILFTSKKVFSPTHVVHIDNVAIGIEIKDAIDDCFNEVDVVANDDKTSRVFRKKLSKPDDRIGIKVVCWFIE